jgi:hypothetical protein
MSKSSCSSMFRHCAARRSLIELAFISSFVAAINEYDQNLWEDKSVNRMSEALMVSG